MGRGLAGTGTDDLTLSLVATPAKRSLLVASRTFHSAPSSFITMVLANDAPIDALSVAVSGARRSWQKCMYALSADLISWPLASVYFDAMRTAELRETAVLTGAGAHLCPTCSAVVHTAENIIRGARIDLDIRSGESSGAFGAASESR